MEKVIRKIIHVDMDAFYASVEQRDNPELQGKPVAVGGSKLRGVVAAASYEARKYGVRSAMPSVTAARLCPDLIFVKHRFEVYKEVSRQINTIFHDYTDLVEPLSLDEAFLDVTENKKGMASAKVIAIEIKQRIKEVTGLNASAGVSINKTLAKIASDMDKPDGLYVIAPGKAGQFMHDVAIEKIPGIGKKTAEKLHQKGFHTGADFLKLDKVQLAQQFGKHGIYYYKVFRNLHNSPVRPHRTRKSMGAERTFSEDLTTEQEMMEVLDKIIATVVERLAKAEVGGKTITLKIKYHDFTQQTRSKTIDHYISTQEEITPIIKELLYTPEFPPEPVRLLGVTLSSLDIKEKALRSQQLELGL